MKKMKQLACSLLFALLFIVPATAQHLYQKGSIQVGKKKFIEAYISIDYRYPQRFQEDITYITPDSYDKYVQEGKLKNKKKIKLPLKDFIGFSLDNGQNFKVVKYMDLTKKGMGLMPKRICLEQIADGKIKAFKMYSNTTGRISYELADVVMDSKMEGDQMLIDYIQDNFQLMVWKEDNSKNPKNINHVNLLNYIGDNGRVKSNYDTNQYGFRNQFVERQKMGVIVDQKYEKAFLKMINDYNKDAREVVGK